MIPILQRKSYRRPSFQRGSIAHSRPGVLHEACPKLIDARALVASSLFRSCAASGNDLRS